MESYSLNIKDYLNNPSELKGKTVLVTMGGINTGTTRRITKIASANKTTIILGGSETKYNWNKNPKGDNSRIGWGNNNSFELITEQYAKELSAEWGRNKLEKQLRLEIYDKLPHLTIEQLKQILNSITAETKNKS